MIINVIALVALNGGEETAVKIEFSDGVHTEIRQHTVLTTQYADLRIKKGEIDKDKYEEIVRAADICSAYKKGLSLLSYSDCSQKKLYYKLKSRGFEDEITSEAVAMLSYKGYLDDGTACIRETEKCLKKLWGKNRIISHLYSKGFNDTAVKEATLIFNDVDFTENCKKLILRDYKRRLSEATDDKAAMTKLIAALIRMGYTNFEIRSALKSIL